MAVREPHRPARSTHLFDGRHAGLIHALLAPVRRHPDLALLLFVLATGLLLRAAFWLRAPVFIIPDSENYFLPGYQLANGLPFTLEARRTPLYPLFIAAVVAAIGRDLAALALAQHALGLLTAGLTYSLARTIFGRLAGLLAGLLVALNGSLLIAEQTVSTETLFTALLVGAALAGVLGLSKTAATTRAGDDPHQRGDGRGTAASFLLAGLLLGLAALVRPVGLGLLPGLPLVLALVRPGWRRWSSYAALYLIGAGLVLLPWMVRNYLTVGVFSTEGAFGQTLVGRTVRHDHFAFVGPDLPADPDPRRQRVRELMHEAASRGSFITPLRRRVIQEMGYTSELEANRLMRDLAIEAVLQQPVYYALSTGRFFVQLAIGWPERLRDSWESRRDGESREEWESHAAIANLLGPPTEVQERQLAAANRLATLYQPGRSGPALLLLFVAGSLVALAGPPRYRPALVPALWAVGLILVGVAAVGPVLRYRYPAEPFLAVLAAGGATALLRWLGTLRWRTAGG